MEKKNIDWANIGFGYIKTDKRFVSNYKEGAWDDGVLTEDDKVVISECAGVLQYAQTCFEGLKAYTTEQGKIVTFRPDLNGERMENSCKKLMMPVFPKEKFVDAVLKTVEANAAYVPPYGRCYTLYQTIYVRKQPCNRCKACHRVSVQNIHNTCWPLFQGRCQAAHNQSI